MFRSVLPLLKRGGIAAGKEILNGGANFINDIGNNISPHTSFNRRAKETVEKLKRKVMYGEGFKASKSPKKRQLLVTQRRAKVKRSKVKKSKKSRKIVKKKSSLKRKSKKSSAGKKNKNIVDIFSR